VGRNDHCRQGRAREEDRITERLDEAGPAKKNRPQCSACRETLVFEELNAAGDENGLQGGTIGKSTFQDGFQARDWLELEELEMRSLRKALLAQTRDTGWEAEGNGNLAEEVPVVDLPDWIVNGKVQAKDRQVTGN
jgi:hypothetical protein